MLSSKKPISLEKPTKQSYLCLDEILHDKDKRPRQEHMNFMDYECEISLSLSLSLSSTPSLFVLMSQLSI